MGLKQRIISLSIASVLISLIATFLCGAIFLEQLLAGYFNYNVNLNSIFESPHFPTITVKLTIMSGIMFFIIFFLSNVFIYFRIGKEIERPITELKQGIEKILNSDEQFRFDVAEKDEIGEIMYLLNVLQEKNKKQVDELVENDRRNMELISSISHDLRTPLTTISGYAEGIIDGVADTDEKRKAYLQKIKNKTYDMNDLIDELLYSSKLDTSKLSYRFTETDVINFVSSTIEEIKIDLDNTGIEAEIVNRSSFRVANIDLERFKRCILNIISNSIKYKKDSSRKIVISFQSTGNHIVICFQDDGIGIEKDKVNLIFDRFYRCDTARYDSTSSSGLGLAITKQIIEGHEGTIWARSKLGEGTKIFISLPAIM